VHHIHSVRLPLLLLYLHTNQPIQHPIMHYVWPSCHFRTLGPATFLCSDFLGSEMLKKKNSKVASCINHFDLPPDRIAKTARCAARISLPAYYKVSNIKPDQKRTEESKDDMIQKGFFFFFFFFAT
jgi:hypothetical protein